MTSVATTLLESRRLSQSWNERSLRCPGIFPQRGVRMQPSFIIKNHCADETLYTTYKLLLPCTQVPHSFVEEECLLLTPSKFNICVYSLAICDATKREWASPPIVMWSDGEPGVPRLHLQHCLLQIYNLNVLHVNRTGPFILHEVLHHRKNKALSLG